MKIIVRAPEIKLLKRTPKKPIKELKEHSLVIFRKPRGPKSRHSTRFLINKLGFVKAGHAGTLDPITTGVLPVFLNRGNKISSVLSLSKKSYRANMRLHSSTTKKSLDKSIKKFTGKIMQMVPKISAVKRQLREREIYKLIIEKIDNKNVTLFVECQAGTYVRKLIHDIGQELGVGAHMNKLERVKSGPFSLKDTKSEKVIISAIKSKKEGRIRKVLIPLEKAVSEMQKVWIDNGALKPWTYGSPIYFSGILQFTEGINEEDKVAVFNQKNELIGIGISKANSKKLLSEAKGIAIRNFINLLKVK